MTIKSLLLGSAAALVAVSGARAADAVVIPEPELVEYVRVCDTYGTGFYYIPGTETCLRISGYVRYEINVTSLDWEFAPAGVAGTIGGTIDVLATDTFPDAVNRAAENGVDIEAAIATLAAVPPGIVQPADNDGWNKRSDVRVNIDARNETELGTLRSYIRLGYDSHPDVDGDNDLSGFSIDHAYITLGGLMMGKNASWWDWGFGADGDALVDFGPGEVGMFAYTVNAGGFAWTLAVEEDNDGDYMPDVILDADGSIGDFSLRAGIAYNESASAATFKVRAGYDFGAFAVNLGYQWADSNSLGAEYLGAFEHVIGGDIEADLTSKLSARAGFNYGLNWYTTSVDVLALGAGVNYALVEGFDIDARVQHVMFDGAPVGFNDYTSGRIRLTRSF